MEVAYTPPPHTHTHTHTCTGTPSQPSRWDFYRRLRSLIGGWLGPNKPNKPEQALHQCHSRPTAMGKRLTNMCRLHARRATASVTTCYLLLATVAAEPLPSDVESADYCSTHLTNAADPCWPGGQWDPLSRACSGYYGGMTCYQCFTGSNCKSRIPERNCTLSSAHGYPVVFQSYWTDAAVQGKPCVSSPVDMVTNYMIPVALDAHTDTKPPGSMILPALDQAIRQLHKLAGNAATSSDDGSPYWIIPGAGSTQAMAAALGALSKLSGSREHVLQAFGQRPYYGQYAYQANNTPHMQWNPDGWSPANAIELLTYPNNPDNSLRKPLLADGQRVVYDCVYLWPHYMWRDWAKLQQSVLPLDKDIMLFSASKMSGHAGSRLGWALVRNATVARAMESVLISASLGVSTDSQLRLLSVIRTLNHQLAQQKRQQDVQRTESPEQPPAPAGMFPVMAALMRSYWEELEAISSQGSGSSQSRQGPAAYRFANREHAGCYVWVQCMAPSNSTCAEHIANRIGLTGVVGVPYGADASYVRFSLLGPKVETEIAIAKLRRLMKGEDTDHWSGAFAATVPLAEVNPRTAAEQRDFDPRWI